MKNFVVAYPNKSCKSGAKLADALGCKKANVTKGFYPAQGRNVFNYGSSDAALERFNPLNNPIMVQIAVNKVFTYERLKAAYVPTVKFVTEQDKVPQSWNWVVCRETLVGANCKGVTITRPYDLVPNCPAYTKFFSHDEEYRIYVFRGKVLGRYRKANLNGGQYDLEYMLPQGFKVLDDACIRATAALGLDFAGVDILSRERTGEYRVLELNSGPLLTDEVVGPLVKVIKELF